MKYLLISFLSLSTLIAVSHGQDRQLNGFMEIPWGASPDQARAALEARSQATYDSGASSPAKRWWNGGTFAGYPATAEHSFALEFYDNKLCKAVVFLKSASPKHKEEFKTMKKLLTEKYGTCNSEHLQGDEWRAEWRLAVMGKQQATITLENAPGSQGCKIIYALHTLNGPASSPTRSGPSKDL